MIGVYVYSLFSKIQQSTTPRFFYLSTEAMLTRWGDAITRLQEHWSRSGYAVPTNHVLVSLLNGLPTPKDVSPLEYRDSIVDELPRLCMGSGIAHPSNARVVPGSSFYGVTQQEILVCVQNDTHPDEAVRNWRALEPVKILRSPSLSVNYGLPNGSGQYVGYGFSVITIDIPLLALMYWGWMNTPREVPERLGQFVGQYILPSMLWSQVNVGWFNYLYGYILQQPIAGVTVPGGPMLPKVDHDLDRNARRILKDSELHMMGFTEMMSTIPALRGTKMIDHIQSPETAVTRQNEWALQLAYFDYVKYVWLHAERFHGSQTLVIRGHLKRLIKRIQNDRLWDAAPASVRPLIASDFDFTLGYSLG